jgi:hypothetical protein
MANALPILLFGAGALLLMGKKKRKKGRIKPSGSPERRWAIEATKQLDLKDEGAMTTWAYQRAYPDAPKRIDPEDPSHEEHMEAWLRIREYIREELLKGKS